MRRALSMGAALGLVTVGTDVPTAWSWSSAGSLAAKNGTLTTTDAATDPLTV